MDSEVYKKTHKRIRELNQFDAEGSDPLYDLVLGNASVWNFPADTRYLDESGAAISPVPTDNGTLRITADKLVVLGTNGKVPAVHLPSYISYIDTKAGTIPDYDPSVEGDVSKVYLDRTTGTFYRYIIKDNGTSGYYPIANNLTMTDGEGTVVTDARSPSSPKDTRKIDIALGTPIGTYQNTLGITQSGQLVHGVSGVSAGSYPGDQPQSVNFGDTFTVPVFTVNSTGHVTGVTTASVTVPSTGIDDSGTAGLATVGTTVTSIGSTNDPGHASAGVSAVNHVHNAATLGITNFPVGSSYTYDMSGNVSMDFNQMLGSTSATSVLPNTSPSNGTYVLKANASQQARWVSKNDFFATASISNATSSVSNIDNTDPGILSWSGLVAGRLYLVNLEIGYRIVNPLVSGSADHLPTVYTLSMYLAGANYTARSFNVNASRCPVSSGMHYEYFSIPFVPTGTTVTLHMSADDNVFGISASGRIVSVGS